MPEHLKTREQIIAWVLTLMADAANWESDYMLATSHNFCYTPLVKDRGGRDPKSPDDPGLGSLYVCRKTNYYGQSGYYVGIYGETPIYVCDTWSLRAMLFDPLGRKFRNALLNIHNTLEDIKAKAQQEASERSYQRAIEQMSSMASGN